MKIFRTAASALLVLWVALLPLQTRFILHQGFLAGGKWEYGTLSIYLTDVLLLAAFIFLVLSRPKGFWKLPRAVPGIVPVVVIGIAGASFVSLLQASDVGVALALWTRMLAGMLAWWFILRSPVRLSWIAVGVIASAAIEAVVALLQFMNQRVAESTLFGIAEQFPSTPGVSVVESVLGRFLRAYGTLPHPNMLAGWLVLALVFTVGLYLRSHDKLERSVLLMAFLVTQTGLFLTFSRGAILTWFAVFLLLLTAVLLRERTERLRPGWFPFHRPHPFLGMKMLKLTIAALLGVGLLTYIFSPLLTVRTGVIGRLERLSVDQRLVQLDDVQRVVERHWIFGTGIGNYTKALHDEIDSKRDPWEYQPVHNVYLLFFSELGVFGALVVIWAIVAIAGVAIVAHRGEWRRRIDRDIPWLAIGSLLLLAVFLISFVDHYFWSLPFGIMTFWAVFGFWSKSLVADE